MERKGKWSCEAAASVALLSSGGVFGVRPAVAGKKAAEQRRQLAVLLRIRKRRRTKICLGINSVHGRTS